MWVDLPTILSLNLTEVLNLKGLDTFKFLFILYDQTINQRYLLLLQT